MIPIIPYWYETTKQTGSCAKIASQKLGPILNSAHHILCSILVENYKFDASSLIHFTHHTEGIIINRKTSPFIWKIIMYVLVAIQ